MRQHHVLALSLALSTACAAEGGGDTAECTGDKCDSLTGDDKPLDSPCADSLFDRSGRDFLPERLAEDALIKHVYMDADGGCPVLFDDIMALMKKSDSKSCQGGPSDAKGLATRVVTEQAQLNASSAGAGYRTITSRTCDGREEFGLLFSLFGFADAPGAASAGLDPKGSGNPDGLEIIAFDETNGVFNYYKEINGKMGFFGSSTDFVAQGPGGPNLTDERGCANCHPGGGINMKELTTPWLHWEGNFKSPGASDLVGSREAVMGALEDGPNLQFDVIQPGNQAWNTRKVDFLKDGPSVAKLLEPLFCPVQVNIASMNAKSKIGPRFLFDNQLASLAGGATAASITLTATHYDRIIGAIGQQVPGSDKADVVAPMAFIERSFEDMDFVDKLVAAGIIDDSFRADVLMVDFTRPVFSNDRCDLLEFAPDLTPEDRTADKIRDGFIANLAGAAEGSPAAQLKAHLEASKAGTSVDHGATLKTFVAACKTRQSSETVTAGDGTVSAFHADVMKLRSLQRKIAFRDGVLDTLKGSAQHPFKVFEFDDTLPADGISVSTSAAAGDLMRVDPEARLSPIDCTLVDKFVPTAAGGGGGGGEADSCEGRCGEFVNGASCQCDSMCSQFGNCCADLEEVCGS